MFGYTDDGAVYYDSAHVKRSGNVVTVWLGHTEATRIDKVLGPGKYEDATKNKDWGYVAAYLGVLVDEHGLDGMLKYQLQCDRDMIRAVGRSGIPESWNEILPRSNFAVLERRVCGGAK